MQGKMQNPALLAASARAQLAAAAQKLDGGDPEGARALLEPLARTEPRLGEAAHLLAVALLRLGAVSDAEGYARRAVALGARQAMVHVTLGDVLVVRGRRTEAEQAYRAALAVNPRFSPALRRLAEHLTDEGRAAEALALLDPVFAAEPPADLGLLSVYASALKLAGRTDEACVIYRKAVDAAPQSGVAEHNLAALLGDLGRNDEAAAAAQRALAKGLNAPETHLVRGRALLALGRNEEAQACLEAAIQLRPSYVDAQRELAQLIWMRTEDLERALAPIDWALGLQSLAGLVLLKAGVLRAAGRHGAVASVLQDALSVHPQDVGLHLFASKAAIAMGDAEHGLELARRAQALGPQGALEPAQFLCEALLAVGDAKGAAMLAEGLVERRPDDQLALAYLATAWRMRGDPRYRGLYDYGAFVRAFELEPPQGWSSRAQFVSDVAAALAARHRFKTHPLEQSLRHGSQVPSIFDLRDPVLDAFRQALDAPIRAYMSALGGGEDPMRRRNTGRYRFQGAWSVRLRPGGLHANHVHGEGWISSACYLELPDAVGRDGSQGSIRFGEPGVPTRPSLAPEYELTPRAGMLLLFPSYMWHGTVPFEGAQSRLTAAFDIVPTPEG